MSWRRTTSAVGLLIATCGTASCADDVLDRSTIDGGLPKRTAAYEVVVPPAAQTQGFSDDQQLEGDGSTQVISGAGYRVSIDLSDYPQDLSHFEKTELAGREASVSKTVARDGSTKGAVRFQSSTTSSKIGPPIIDWICEDERSCDLAERIISSLDIKWAAFEATNPPPEAPPQPPEN